MATAEEQAQLDNPLNIRRMGGADELQGMVGDASKVSQQSGTGKSAKNRAAVAVGTAKKEITWVDGDDITELSILAEYQAAAVVGSATRTSQYLLVCVDVAAAGVASLIGADGSVVIPENLSGNQNSYMIPVGEVFTLQFANTLSYDGTTYVGNMWVRAINNTDKLDVWVGAS